ncbi:bifunctional 2-polyprenyl-6-hydroxyphenol methylase/3-demethylubiquinol 3-O-methyltransferase UbiG [Gammaproteobacteria bacterium]|nr:bifunctional 2-polyprenyl-6-hydroxyphenol methylase/3-demethylubiquinol 3-O-methyltransferase UbiG [Gammaproteobacteria bacterium]
MKSSNKFTDQPNTWWDPKGPFWTLHAINPLRCNFIQKHLKDIDLLGLDIGCGGGILTEALAKNHTMIGIDVDTQLIEVAKSRQQDHITYLPVTSTLLRDKYTGKFDFITCLEVLEHVEDPKQIISDIYHMLKPGGFAFYSTLNRNPISFLGAIVAAEYILNLLPKHTHLYEKFIKPSEMVAWNQQHELTLLDMTGIHYNPLTRNFFVAKSTIINYIACFQKPLPRK